jgi:hypothetical protein
MNCQQRIREMAEEEFPGSTVEFDPDAGEFVRFKIRERFGKIVSRALPHYRVAEIDGWSDDELRLRIRMLCGFN